MFYDQEILNEFKVEATELLCSSEEDILELEDHRDDKELINRIFRAFHTIKGNAAMIGFEQFASLSHHAEDILSKVRSGGLIPNRKMVDVLLQVVDMLKTLLDKAMSDDIDVLNTSELIARLQGIAMDGGSNVDITGSVLVSQGQQYTPEVSKAGDLRILVAEDDFTSREILRLMLSDYGVVSEVENGEEAVKYIRDSFEKSPMLPFHVVCLDIMMPELDGMEAAKQIRVIEREKGISQRDEAAIIMITALDDPKTVLKSLYKCGATSYLVKPVSRPALEKELRKLLLI